MPRPLPPAMGMPAPEPSDEMEMPAASPMELGGDYAEESAEGDTAEKGYSCEGTFPLTDPMWTNDVKQGQPTGV